MQRSVDTEDQALSEILHPGKVATLTSLMEEEAAYLQTQKLQGDGMTWPVWTRCNRFLNVSCGARILS